MWRRSDQEKENGCVVLKGRVLRGIEVGLWIEYDENWMKNGRCLEYEEGVLKRECVYEHGMRGFYSEVNRNRDLLTLSEYDYDWTKTRIIYEIEGGILKKEYIYEDGMTVCEEYYGDEE